MRNFPIPAPRITCRAKTESLSKAHDQKAGQAATVRSVTFRSRVVQRVCAGQLPSTVPAARHFNRGSAHIQHEIRTSHVYAAGHTANSSEHQPEVRSAWQSIQQACLLSCPGSFCGAPFSSVSVTVSHSNGMICDRRKAVSGPRSEA